MKNTVARVKALGGVTNSIPKFGPLKFGGQKSPQHQQLNDHLNAGGTVAEEKQELFDSIKLIRSSAPPVATASVPKTDREGRADPELWAKSLKSIKTIELQLKEGRDTLQNLSKFFEKYIKIQKQFSQELSKLCKVEMGRPESDLMRTMTESFVDMYQNILRTSEAHQSHAMDVEAFVVEKLSRFEDTFKRQTKDVLAEYREVNNQINSSKQEVLKQKSKCVKALQSIDKKGVSEPVSKAYEACLKYESMVSAGVIEAEEYFRVHLPAIFAKAQEVEEGRCLEIQRILGRFVTSFDNLPAAYSYSNERLKLSFSRLNLKDDITNIVQVSTANDPAESCSFEYELSTTSRDLVSQIEPEKREQFGIGRFERHSLEETMELQLKSRPTLHLPLIVIRLRDALRYLNGYQMEGIFRISADQKRLDSFIQQLKENDYTIKWADPHVPAATLKQWLRELPEPLIPGSLYAECIRAGDRATAEQVNSLVSGLPAANKALIHALASMARAVSSPENVSINKMTMSNLAIVLTPSILREPMDTKDPSNFLKNYNAETNFVTKLLTLLQIDDTLLDENLPDTNVYLCDPLTENYVSRASSTMMTQEMEARALPVGWTCEIDAESNTYYANAEKNISQWEFPEEEKVSL